MTLPFIVKFVVLFSIEVSKVGLGGKWSSIIYYTNGPMIIIIKYKIYLINTVLFVVNTNRKGRVVKIDLIKPTGYYTQTI